MKPKSWKQLRICSKMSICMFKGITTTISSILPLFPGFRMNAEEKIILKSNLWQNHNIWNSYIPRCVHKCIFDGLIMNMYIDDIFLKYLLWGTIMFRSGWTKYINYCSIIASVSMTYEM